MNTIEEINQKREQLMRELAEINMLAEAETKRARQSSINEVLALMKERGLTIDDLDQRRRKAKSGEAGDQRKTVAPKYRDPIGGMTWTGRGKEPIWLKNAVSSGRSRDEYLIK